MMKRNSKNSAESRLESMMRISFKTVSAKLHLWMYWCNWRGWLYLTAFILTSSHLFFSQRFLPTFSNQINSVIPKPTWTKSLFEKGQMNREGVNSSNQLIYNESHSTIFTAESDNINWTSLTSKKSIGNDENNETYQQRREKQFDQIGSIKEKERQYWLRSERIKRICHNEGVVSNPPVFTISKKSLPVHSDSSINLPVSLTEEYPVTSHFSLAPSFQTMGCFLNKVASSSLVSAFLLVRGLSPTLSSPHRFSGHLLPRSLEDFQFANQTFFKFMFVRHPMDRMLSCYLDKMVESPHHSLPAFRNYVTNKAREIMIKRRQQRDTGAASLRTDKPQVRSLLFVHQSASLIWNRVKSKIIHDLQLEKGNDRVNYEAEKMKEKKLHRSRPDFIPSQRNMKVNASLNEINETQIKPTFEEFLEFVLDTDLLGLGYDSHWVPFHRYCSPCSVPYHVIGKLETAADDFQYIWDKTGLGAQVPVPWINRKAAPSKSKIALEKKYYSSLPRELILRFYNAFRLDFELFDYSINDILVKAGYTTMT